MITNTESPIVVVLRCVDLTLSFSDPRADTFAFAHTPLSGSMEPAFYRGDLLFLVNPPNKRYETGDITVYRIPGQDIPIVHRVLETHDVVKTVNGFVSFFFTGRQREGSALLAAYASPRLAPRISYSSPREITTTLTI